MNFVWFKSDSEKMHPLPCKHQNAGMQAIANHSLACVCLNSPQPRSVSRLSQRMECGLHSLLSKERTPCVTCQRLFSKYHWGVPRNLYCHMIHCTTYLPWWTYEWRPIIEKEPLSQAPWNLRRFNSMRYYRVYLNVKTDCKMEFLKKTLYN